MRFALGFFFFILLSTSVLAEVDPDRDPLFVPSEGELSVGIPAENGKGIETVRYRYGFGESQSTPENDEKIIRELAKSLDPESSEPHIIDVFAEDVPEDLARGEKIVEKINAATSKISGEVPSASRIEAHVVPIPSELNRGKILEEKSPTIFSELKKAFKKPGAHEVRTGVIIGSFRAVFSFTTWFATPGISPLLATGIATFQTSLTTFHATFARSMANVFKVNLSSPGGVAARSKTVTARRLAYGLIITELTRVITGTPPGFDPMNSWAGQAQLVTLSLGFTALDSLVMSARDDAFLGSPRHFARLNLINFMFLTPWTLLDTAGTFPVLLDLSIYKVRASTFGMLATYFTFYGSLRLAPDKVAKFLDSVFDPIENSLGKIKRKFGERCGNLLKSS